MVTRLDTKKHMKIELEANLEAKRFEAKEAKR